MPNYIRVKQIDQPELTGFFVDSISSQSGLLINIASGVVANQAVLSTGNQTISGVKTFASRPTVNGTGVLLSGEAALLPNTLVYLTGNQTISGVKTFDSPIAFVLGGSINLIGDEFGGIGGSISAIGGGQKNGGSLNMNATADGVGGSINTSAGNDRDGGSINTTNGGGSINTAGINGISGGFINTFGATYPGGNIDLSNNSGASFSIQTGNLPTQNNGSIYNKINDNLYIRKNSVWEKVITDKQSISGVFIIENSETAPSAPVKGQLFFDTINNNFSGYNGTSWVKLNN